MAKKLKYVFTDHARDQFKKRFTELYLLSSSADRTLRQLILACDLTENKKGLITGVNGKFRVIIQRLSVRSYKVITVTKRFER